MPTSASTRQPSTVMASWCVGKDGVNLPAVAPLPADRSEAWEKVDKGPLSPQRFWDGISDTTKINDPRIFQILSTEHYNKKVTVANSITLAFRRKIDENRITIEESMRNKVKGQQLSCTKTPPRQPAVKQPALGTLSFPLEIIDKIIENSLEYRFQFFIWLDKPPKAIKWVGRSPSLMMPCYDERPWQFTKEDEAILLENLHLTDAWPLITSVPLFHVCKTLRERLMEVAVRKWAELEPWIEGEARISYLSPKASATGKNWMRVGILQPSSTRPQIPPESRLLRDIPYNLRVVWLHFETIWSWEKQTLLTPLRDILGFANYFGHFRSITVSCRIPILELDSKPSCEELAQTLYSRENGVFSTIVGEIAAVFDVAAWDVVTGRSGLWPDYCLLPNCMRHIDDVEACRHAVPALSYRILNVQISLIPILI